MSSENSPLDLAVGKSLMSLTSTCFSEVVERGKNLIEEYSREKRRKKIRNGK